MFLGVSKIKILESFKMIDSTLLIDNLLDCGVTYCSITLLDQDGKACFSKCSSDKWVDIYINSGLYQKCHLMREAAKQIQNHKNSFIFMWDNYSPDNEESTYLNHLRVEKNISHGAAFCSPLSNGGKSIITVTGKASDINFTKNVMRNKNIVYQSIMKSFARD